MLGWAGTADPKQVQSVFERALRILEESRGLEHISTARCLVGIGKAMAYAAESHQALEFGTRALKIIEAAHGPDTIESSDALGLLGTAHYFLKESSVALQHHTRRLAVLEAHFGKNAEVREIAEVLKDAGDVCSQQNEPTLALSYYMRALPIAEATAGKLASDTGILLGNIGTEHSRQRQHVEAARWFDRAVAAFKFARGAEDDFTMLAKRDLERAQGAADAAAAYPAQPRHRSA